MYSKLQYISQGTTATEQITNIRAALDAGCEWIQLRFKNASTEEIKVLAKQIKEMCLSYTAIFIINDHPQIAKETDADGVHLGLQDMPVAEAKKIIGDKIIGGTANTLSDVLKRVDEGCSYIGLGPFRFTTTKEQLSPVLGLEGYKKIMNELEQRQIQMPVYAIGGIGSEDIQAIIQTGVYGVAVSGVITNHPDKKLLVQQLNKFLYETINDSR
ncbi:MAG TPA: thiamine phosphate synthase [Chitinophagaceae bacterium]